MENEYIFEVVKANLLIPFYYTKKYKVLLPIDRDFQRIEENKLKPLMKSFYKKINDEYIKNKKVTTKFNELWENLNYQNKLTNQKPELYKVVFNEAGTKLKAAVLDKNILIDYTLLY